MTKSSRRTRCPSAAIRQAIRCSRSKALKLTASSTSFSRLRRLSDERMNISSSSPRFPTAGILYSVLPSSRAAIIMKLSGVPSSSSIPAPDYLQPEFVDPLLRESQLAEVEQNLVERNLAEVVNPAPLDPPESLAAGREFVNASRDVETALVVFGDERSERGDEEFGAGDLQFVQSVDEERDAALCEQLLGVGEHHALPVLGRRDSEARVEGRPQGVVHRLAFGDRVEVDPQGQDRTVAVVPQGPHTGGSGGSAPWSCLRPGCPESG